MMHYTLQLLRHLGGDEALGPARLVTCEDPDEIKRVARGLLVRGLVEARQRAGVDAPKAVCVLQDGQEIFRWTYQDEAETPERRAS